MVVLLSYISNSLIRTRTRDCAHVRLRIMGLEMLVFRKILRTYLMDGPLCVFENYQMSFLAKN